MSPIVHAYALPTGYFHVSDNLIFADGDQNMRHWSPNFSFLVYYLTRDTIQKTRHLRELDSVLVVLAHGASLQDVLPLYPSPLNGWRH
jgi:hypothetical protein